MLNQTKTFLLMLALTLVLILVGNLLGGKQGMVMAFVFAALMNFFGYWFSDKVVLAMYRAKPVEKDAMPELYSVVETLTRKENLPMPKLYVIPQSSPNAFATGRDPKHAAVAVTEGILSILNRQELAGVIAHELGHVKNRDILISTIAATLAGAIMMLSRWALFFGGGSRDDDNRGNGLALIVAVIIAPLAAMLIQMAISRSREYLADARSAEMTGNPLGLANALRKLESSSRSVKMQANEATAHMFIVNPLKGKGLMTLFSTHPSTEERIKRLENMRFA